jgi:hypothetical protein
MVADRPDQEDRSERIDQREQQTAIEGRRRPQRRRRGQAESMRKERLAGLVFIAEEGIDPIEKCVQLARILARDPIARGDPLPQRIVVVALARSNSVGSRPEHSKIVQHGEAKGENPDKYRDPYQRDQRCADSRLHVGRKFVPKWGKNDSEDCRDHGSDQRVDCRLIQIPPLNAANSLCSERPIPAQL